MVKSALSQNDIVKRIQEICGKALEANLRLDEFHKKWPADADTNPFFRQVYEDVEDGVEHTPGNFFNRKIDYDSWRKSSMYFTIYLDLNLLRYERSADELLKCRNTVLSQQPKNVKEIESLIEGCLKY